MICRYFILMLALWLPNWALAQDRSANVESFLKNQDYFVSNDIRYSNLEKKVKSLIRKNAYIGKSKGLRRYHVFVFATGSMITTKDYRDGKFLEYLWCEPHWEHYPNRASQAKKAYLSALTLITDSLGNLVADFNGYNLFTYPPYKYNRDPGRPKIAKMFFNGELDFAFIFWSDPYFYICFKGNEMFVIDDSKGKFKRMSWDEFVDTYIVNGFPKPRPLFWRSVLSD